MICSKLSFVIHYTLIRTEYSIRLAVPYLHSLVVVLNSLQLLWPLSAAEMTTAKENPEQIDNTVLVQMNSNYSN